MRQLQNILDAPLDREDDDGANSQIDRCRALLGLVKDSVLCHFAPDLLQKIQQLTADTAFKLLEAWRGMTCRNGDVVEYNRTLT